ncbi:hypothetical protein BC832DRAFT_354352 [Gaertneriomyces semiglobifer]|nr:hypothetical protein BC832DRAFT_354352 [Gaertneriomyces semiglobifer]
MSNSLITELTIPTLPISSSNIYFLPYFFVLGKDVDAVESALLTNCDEAAREEVQQIANYFRVVPLIKRETDQHDLLEDGTTGTALARYLGILEEGSEIWRLDVTEVLTLMCIVISRGVRTVDVTVTELVRRCESEVGQGRREEGVFFVVDILRRLMGCLPKVKGEIMDAVVKEVNDESEIVKQLSITHPRLLLRSLSRLHRHHSLFVATVLHHNDFTYVLPTLTTTYFHNPSSSTLNALHALKPHLLNIASEINLRCIILLRCIGVPFSGSDLQPFMELYTRMYPPHGPRHGVSSLSSLVLPFSLAFLVQIKELPILSTLLEACLVPAVLNLVFPALKLRELEKECGKRLGVIGEEVRLPRECMAALQEVVRAYLGDPWTLPSLLSDTEPVHVSLLMYILNLVTSPVDIKEYLNAILCPDAPPWEHRVSDEDLEALISVCEYQQK